MKFKNFSYKIPAILQHILNISLLILALFLCIMLGKEVLFFFKEMLVTPTVHFHYDILERILIFFLYFEFISMIVKYFQEDYHFPLRYFIYIGITALLRLIIVSHENPLHTLLHAFAILVLIIGYFLINSARAKKDGM